MARDFLGGIELLVLLAVIKLGDGAYGVPIAAEIEASSGKRIAIGSLYLTLKRLEEKKLITSYRGEPTAVRGGRAKTHVEVTAKGIRAAVHAQRTLATLWRGVPQLQGEPS
jgi:DNA-binding PadR family transcriptional regulator